MSPKTEVFEKHLDRYERWFEEHRNAYMSELEAVRELLPGGEGVEIGVGTGRFAAPLGIGLGVEPSEKLASVAESRGVRVIRGVAEDLPLGDSSFDFALLVTTICFLDDPEKALREVNRILRPGGHVIIGFVDAESPLGKRYRSSGSPFYRVARFFTVREVMEMLEKAGFCDFEFRQTIFGDPDEMERPDPVLPGHGKGSFVVVRARKCKNIGRP